MEEAKEIIARLQALEYVVELLLSREMVRSPSLRDSVREQADQIAAEDRTAKDDEDPEFIEAHLHYLERLLRDGLKAAQAWDDHKVGEEAALRT
ncbi:hypothetical protein GA0004734_00033850 [Rhizobium sp. 9140]|nr:hypothetical protein GA0004734_00033850 [Rhizobium sp. 9140]